MVLATKIDNQAKVIARPFLKWAGGKGQLLRQFESLFPKPSAIRRYFEPFSGSGAVYLYLYNQGRVQSKDAHLWDLNPTLINAWRWIRDDPMKVEEILRRLDQEYDPDNPETYYVNRERFNSLRGSNSVESAALLICLNHTCFNGLYRENRKGVFNVPIGRYRNPKILNAENLWAVSCALRETSLECRSFQHILQEAKPGDFVYFDPPYEPLNKTSQFTDYSKDGFNADDQRLLAAVFEELTRRKVRCMLSNSTAPLITELYGDLSKRHKRISLHRVIARRSINSKATNRSPVEEIVVKNF